MAQALIDALAVLTALGAALMGGLFFAFSNFIMTALGSLPAVRGIAAMQAINVDVLNRGFFAVFFGTALAALALAVLGAILLDGGRAVLLAAGALLYLAGCILVTMRINVPLNRRLAAAEPDSADGAALWARYLRVWTRWTHVRTAAGLAAAACIILALA